MEPPSGAMPIFEYAIRKVADSAAQHQVAGNRQAETSSGGRTVHGGNYRSVEARETRDRQMKV